MSKARALIHNKIHESNAILLNRPEMLRAKRQKGEARITYIICLYIFYRNVHFVFMSVLVVHNVRIRGCRRVAHF